MGLRSKLIWLFVTIKVLPLILLAWLAWTQSEKLANVLSQHYREFETVSRDSLQKIGGQAIDDSMASIEDRARSEIERLTTDTAKQIAHFLYARDDDVRLISAQQPSLQNYQSFLQHRNVMAPMQHVWEFSDSQNQWLQVGVPSKTTELVAPLGENKSNEHVLPENSRAYHSRPPETTNQFVKKPLYHEITFVSLTGQELIKVSNSDLLSKQLRDISDTQNTFIKAESYFSHLARLQPGEVYVSDVIGAYVPAHFIGNYTRDRAMKEGG